jgi:hypothetical protein
LGFGKNFPNGLFSGIVAFPRLILVLKISQTPHWTSQNLGFRVNSMKVICDNSVAQSYC